MYIDTCTYFQGIIYFKGRAIKRERESSFTHCVTSQMDATARVGVRLKPEFRNPCWSLTWLIGAPALQHMLIESWIIIGATGLEPAS